MTAIAKLAFVCGAVGCCAAFAFAQDGARTAKIVLTPQSSLSDQMRAREAARAATIRKEWLAAGHTIEPAGEPQITAGKVLTPKLNAAKQPAAPEYSVTFKTGPAGLSFISAYFDSPGGTQSLEVSYSTSSNPLPVTSGTLKIRQPGNSYGEGMFNPYSIPGSWVLEYLYIYDRASHQTSYDQTQIAALFPSATIALTNNGKPDGVAPVISAGKILTPTVKLSSTYPYFRTQLTVSDNLSGVNSVAVWVRAPGSSDIMSGYNQPPAPLKSGKVGVANTLGASPKTGTWTIAEVDVCDVARNCLYDSSASDIQGLFGTTTFKVRH